IDERFDAMARNLYWQNVTRFYAGCFSKGELPTLVDRLEVLCQEGDLSLTAYPRNLAATLAADWVFSQHQRSLKNVIKLLLADEAYRSLLGTAPTSLRTGTLALPDGCGRSELIDRCFEVLQQSSPDDVRRRVAKIAQANSSVDNLKKTWLASAPGENIDDVRQWLRDGYYLGALPRSSYEDLVARFPIDVLLEAGITQHLAAAGCYQIIDKDPKLVAAYLARVRDGNVIINAARVTHDLAIVPLIVSSLPFTYAHQFFGSKTKVRDVLERGSNAAISRQIVASSAPQFAGLQDKFRSFLKMQLEDAASDNPIVNDLLLQLHQLLGARSFAMYRSFISLADFSPQNEEIASVDLLDDAVPIRMRALRA
ncbi:hypothetical protein ACFQ07_23665, partial [Actinomadura adrarensis]